MTKTEQASAGNAVAFSSYRWVMIATAALTGLIVYAMPLLSIPVLFPEISADLSLSIVQVGVIWGVGSLTGVVMALMGGLLGDRFGTRNILITACLLSGILGASRGFSGTFLAFVVTSFLFGLVQPIIPTNLHKIAGAWFPHRQLGLATGIISTGFATGLMLGSLLSASVFSPALGGWQGVLFLYGILAIVMAGVWFVVHPKQGPGSPPEKGNTVPFRASLSHVGRIRNIWLVGLGGMGFWGCARGFIGYLPTYLRDIGWSPNRADQALTLFFAASLLAAIPFSMLTDRYRLRREYLIFAALMMATGVGLMTFAQGFFVFIAVLIAGVVFDGFMAIIQATVLEIPGVGLVYAGTALGFSAMLREMGGMYSPPIGNSLTAYGANVPFVFWSSMALLGAIAFVIFRMRDYNKVRPAA
jgi:cyanate permease